MKINNKALKLIGKGLSSKTVSKLTESQIDTLYSKLCLEVTMVSKQDGDTITRLKTEKKPFEVYEKDGEVDESETDDIDDQNALGADALQDLTGQDAPHMANDMAPDGMDDDSDNNRTKMGMAEEDSKSSPYAICYAQVGAKRTRKFERCLAAVKKNMKEGKNPVSLFLENEIMKIVERNIPPRITKGDLVKYLSEQGPSTAPSKPKTSPTTKPGTRPGTKPQRPAHPLKNPNPGEKPAPKAEKVSKEKAKEEVINMIINLLDNE